MRKVLTILTTLLVVSLQAARADVNSNSAPADEYFGPYRQSVLEIRNRLNDCDVRDDQSMLDPDVPVYLDHLQLAMRDWQHRYPRDPWLPVMLGHLVREYWRAGQLSSERGMAALALMQSAYPDSAETAATVSLVYRPNTTLTDIARDGAVVIPAAADTASDGEVPTYAGPGNDVPPAR